RLYDHLLGVLGDEGESPLDLLVQIDDDVGVFIQRKGTVDAPVTLVFDLHRGAHGKPNVHDVGPRYIAAKDTLVEVPQARDHLAHEAVVIQGDGGLEMYCIHAICHICLHHPHTTYAPRALLGVRSRSKYTPTPACMQDRHIMIG